ncbi:hypothetical protein [Streptomyces sp. KR55]|uniref:hypothetical protein n=1 Tax=Streptomyces sp. KR55 TaxID=3457425 RepID=UPI003FD68E11
MTTQITFRPGTAGLMAALSIAETLAANSPAVPSSIDIDSGDFDLIEVEGVFERPIGVTIYFHRSPENVLAFAEKFGATVGERPHGDEDTYTYADGVLDGVPFRAWALERAADKAVAA